MINKIDLAPYVGASLEIMERDSRKQRGDRPFLFTNLRDQVGLAPVVEWVEEKLGLPAETRHSVIDAHAPLPTHSHEHSHHHHEHEHHH